MNHLRYTMRHTHSISEIYRRQKTEPNSLKVGLPTSNNVSISQFSIFRSKLLLFTTTRAIHTVVIPKYAQWIFYNRWRSIAKCSRILSRTTIVFGRWWATAGYDRSIFSIYFIRKILFHFCLFLHEHELYFIILWFIETEAIMLH